MEDSQIVKFCNAMIVPLHKIANGGDLLQPTYEITTIKTTKCYLHGVDHPYPNNMLLNIHVNKSKNWKSIPGDVVDKCPSKILGRIKEPTVSTSFSIPYGDFFTSHDCCLAQLHDQIISANIVRTQFCDILSARIAESASQIIQAILEVYKEPRSFLVEVEVETVTTVEYLELSEFRVLKHFSVLRVGIKQPHLTLL